MAGLSLSAQRRRQVVAQARPPLAAVAVGGGARGEQAAEGQEDLALFLLRGHQACSMTVPYDDVGSKQQKEIEIVWIIAAAAASVLLLLLSAIYCSC